MKPSERIPEIVTEIISTDWVNYGGNTQYESFESASQKDFTVWIKAILKYLDETHKESSDAK